MVMSLWFQCEYLYVVPRSLACFVLTFLPLALSLEFWSVARDVSCEASAQDGPLSRWLLRSSDPPHFSVQTLGLRVAPFSIESPPPPPTRFKKRTLGLLRLLPHFLSRFSLLVLSAAGRIYFSVPCLFLASVRGMRFRLFFFLLRLFFFFFLFFFFLPFCVCCL